MAKKGYLYQVKPLFKSAQRFLSVDPAAEDYAAWSTYAYVMDAPVLYKDSDGRRTIFFAGLGYDETNPAPYARSIEMVFSRFLGDKFLTMKRSNFGRLNDMYYVKKNGNNVNPNYDIRVKNAFEDICADICRNPLGNTEKFNLVGTSMGSVVAAQTAIKLLEQGVVTKIDNLVLGGSPIYIGSPLFQKLIELQNQGLIGNIIYDDVQIPGDNISGCADKGCGGAAYSMAKQGMKHPHVAVAFSEQFGHALARILLGELGIEGEEVQEDVKSSYPEDGKTMLNEIIGGTSASQEN